MSMLRFRFLQVFTVLLIMLFVATLVADEANAGGNTKYYRDADSDTYGDPNDWVRDTSPPAGYVADGTDCDDTDPAVNPGVTEVCDGIDNNCDGQVDEGCGGGTQTYYRDADGDTYGDLNDSVEDTSPPAGYVADSTDCDDTDTAVNPGAAEICGNGVDENCDGTDDACSAGRGKKFYYLDADGDTYGDPNNFVEDKNPPPGYVNNNVDCDDTNPAVNPGATEACDAVDNNCDGQVDEGCATYYEDSDSDTYGNSAVYQVATSQPAGYVVDSTDCDDTDPAVNPGAAEVCDGIDNNCDGQVDEVCATYYLDSDGDTYGDPGISVVDTSAPPGYVPDGTDCDDLDPAVNPGATEACDGVDNNCNSIVDEGCSIPLTIRVPEESPTILEAILAAQNGYTVLVNDGMYFENIDFFGKSITVKSVNGPETTAISGGGGSVVTFFSGEGPDSILDGFTIRDGFNPMGGGGIRCFSSSPLIRNCIITQNVADTIGGNSGGAGIQCSYFAAPTIENCYITYNHLISFDGRSGGGGICATDDSTPVIINCTISNNISDTTGGGVTSIYYSNIILKNCTITKNYAFEGGAMSFIHTGGAEIINTIVSGNDAYMGYPFAICCTAGPIISEASLIDMPVPPEITGFFISLPPMFVDPANDDFHLSAGSPCIDAGVFLPDVTDDIDGDSRPQGIGFDIGSDEYYFGP